MSRAPSSFEVSDRTSGGEPLVLPRDVSRLLGWLLEATPGTLVPAVEIAERIRSLPVVSRPATPEPATADEMLTADGVAHWLKIDRQAVYRMARDGRLPCVRLGGNTVRFKRSVIETWLERRAG